jgi:hypothetical protein
MDKEKLHEAATLLEKCGIDLRTLLHDGEVGLQEVDPKHTAEQALAQEQRATAYLRAARYLR